MDSFSVSAVVLLVAVAGMLLPSCASGDCAGQAHLLPNDPDPSAPGPYPVSHKLLPGTFTDRNLTVEVFYPAVPGSESGAANMTLDMRNFLTPSLAKKIPPHQIPKPFYLNAFEDLPPAWDRSAPAASWRAPPGKGFPVIVFVHGTAGWRSQSLSLVVHWASRGFVVVSADYPGICLHDLLDLVEEPFKKHPRIDQVGDTRKLITVLNAMEDPRLVKVLGTPHGAVDTAQNALIGHSAGAYALSGLCDLAKVAIPMAGAGTKPSCQGNGGKLVSTLLLGAFNDTEAPIHHQQHGYETTPRPKRLVIGANMGHQAFSDLCYIGEDQGGITGIGKKDGIWEAYAFAPLAVDGCSFHNPGFFEPQKNWGLIEFASSAVLEETLRCDAAMATTFRTIRTKFDFVAEAREQL